MGLQQLQGCRPFITEAASKFVNGNAMLLHCSDLGLADNSYAIQVRVGHKVSHLILMGVTVAKREGNTITITEGVPSWLVDELTNASTYTNDDLSELMD